MTVGTRLALAFLGVALAVASVGYFSMATLESAWLDAIGDDLDDQVTTAVHEIDENVQHELADLCLYARYASLGAIAAQSNREFAAMPNRAQRITEVERVWVAGKDTPYIRGILDNALSVTLKQHLPSLAREKGHPVLTELFVTNKYGVVIGSTGRTSDYEQADEPWYQNAAAGGRWIGAVEYDESSGSLAMDLVVALQDEDGQFAGVVKGVLSIERTEALLQAIQARSRYKSARAYLVDRDGWVVSGTENTEPRSSGKDLTLAEFSDNVSERPAVKEAMKVGSGHLVFRDGDREILAVFSRSKREAKTHRLDWVLVIEYDAKEVLHEVLAVKRFLLLASSLVTVLAVFGGTVYARSLTTRINRLTLAAREVAAGKLDAQVRKTGGRDEINVLARTFNEMTQHLVETRDRLEEEMAERAQTEEELRSSEEQFRTLFEASSDAVMLFRDGAMCDCNAATLHVFGCKDKMEFCGKHPSELSPQTQPDGSDSLALANARIGAAIEQGSNHFEWVHRRLDGTDFPADVLLNIMDLKGEITVQAVVRDITDRKKAEEELKSYSAALESTNKALEKMNHAAEAASRAKSTFLANMSHEIRTPMTAILGFADVLLHEEGIENAPPDRIEALRTIDRNGKYLLRLINDILDLSKIEAGKLEVERVACSPAKILDEVISLMRVRTEAKGLSLDLQYAGEIPETIQSDPTRLRQILINLLGNSIKFTETGGVQLVARLVEGVPQRVQFDVVDTGIGVTDEQASRLFQPFSQADPSTTRQFGGTGLGLAISKRLAQMLGGDIVARSIPGVGSTFSLTVETGWSEEGAAQGAPSEMQLDAHEERRAEPAGQPVSLSCRVLLAEDSPDNQRLISFILKKAGAEVAVVENGQQACEEALSAQTGGQPFDVILMDMQMPIMDGYEATRQLRKGEYTRPIIAITANAMAGDDVKCHEAGCDDYTTKPIDREELVTLVRQYADKSEAVTAAPDG